MSYLTVEEAAKYFSKFEECSKFLDCLEEFIVDATDIINCWLDRDLCPQEYCQTSESNHQGKIQLRHFPVISVISIEAINSIIYQNNQPTVLFDLDPSVVWDGHLTIDTGNCDCSRYNYKIIYQAGYDPLPPGVKRIFKSILREALETGSFDGLYESPMEIEEVQNPSVAGSFKQRFSRGKHEAGATRLDLLMTPLKKYRSIKFV